MSLGRALALIKIRPDEARMAALVALLFGLVDLSRAIGDSAADALFFRRFGVEYLPYLYIGLGIITFIAALGYAGLLGRFNKQRFFPVVLLLMALVLLAERAAITLEVRALYPVLWLTVNVIGALLGTLLWTTAGDVCDARQAKRLFPIFVSASILGSLLGSLIIGPTARLLGTDNLILLCVVLLTAGAFLVRSVARHYFRTANRPREASTFLTDIHTGFDYVKRAPLLQLLAVSAVLFSILYFSVSFPFGRAVSASFASEADLAGFLGLFKGISSALMFVAALLIANRLYARIGIVYALLILPITYLFGFVVFAVRFTLSSAVVVRLAQFVVLSGIGDGAYSAFFNVVPQERRAQVRAFDAGVPSQIGVILSGILLILGERWLTNTEIFIMGMVVAVLCAFVVWRMRRRYVDALVAALKAGRIDAFSDGDRIFAGLAGDSEAVRIMTSTLYDPKPLNQQLAAEMLARIRAAAAIPVLIERLAEATPEVRVAILRALGQLAANEAVRPVAALLQDGSPAVRSAALEALPSLCGRADPDVSGFIRPLLQDPEVAVRAEAAISLAKIGDGDTGLHALVSFLQDAPAEQAQIDLLKAFEPALRAADSADENAVGEAIAALVRYVHDESPAVRRAACQGLAPASAPAALESLAECLSDPVPEVRAAAARSLQYAGAAGIPFVLPRLRTAPDPALVLSALPAGSPSVRDPLRSYAQAELGRLTDWREAIQALPRAGKATAFLLFMLESRSVQAEQQLLRIIGLLSNEAVMQLVARTLKTGNSEARATAIEALDTLGDKQLVKAFLPFLEPASADAKRSLDRTRQTEPVIRRLIAEEDQWLRAVAMRAAGELGLTGLIPEVRLWAACADGIVCEAARETLHQLGEAVETLPTLSQVERTLLLRDVPLFSDLSVEDLVQIAHIARERWYADGAPLCREGEAGDEMYIIAAGRVRVTRHIEGSEQVLAIRKAGDFVGEMAIIDAVPRFATVSALGDARALVINSEMFQAILRDRPEVSLALMRGLSRRLREQR